MNEKILREKYTEKVKELADFLEKNSDGDFAVELLKVAETNTMMVERINDAFGEEVDAQFQVLLSSLANLDARGFIKINI